MDSSFIDHEEEVTESAQYICDTYGNSYSSKSNLRRHVKSHSETSEQRCEQCCKTFTSSFNLTKHRKIHEQRNTILLCPHCGEIYKTKHSLDSHIRFKHTESGMICETCQKRFRDNYALRRHRQSHEETSTLEMCTKCNGYFKHLKNHSINCKAKKAKELKCDICKVSFSEKKDLSMHIKRKHTTTPKSYQCGCGKSFLYTFSIKRHSKACKQAE